MDQWDRDHQHVDDMLEQGLITPKQAHEDHRAIDRDYQEAAMEASQQAYENELRNW